MFPALLHRYTDEIKFKLIEENRVALIYRLVDFWWAFIECVVDWALESFCKIHICHFSKYCQATYFPYPFLSHHKNVTQYSQLLALTLGFRFLLVCILFNDGGCDHGPHYDGNMAGKLAQITHANKIWYANFNLQSFEIDHSII